MWWDEARIRMAANPNKTLEEFNSFMGHFVKKRGKGTQNQGKMDQKQKENQIVSRIDFYLSMNSAGKAFRVLAYFESGVEYTPISEQEQ